MKKERKEKQNKPQKWGIYRNFFKRFLDIFLSGLALILLSPVMFVVWCLVRIKLGGPAIFVQPRPGKNGKPFLFYKFRSMTNEKDENGNLLPDEKRLTKFGKFLRKSSLDELPQLWNIFKGDMSIIGPRPKLIKDMVFFSEETMKSYSVRPGLTGLAQINCRDTSPWGEVFEWNKKYEEKITFWKDTKIFFKTFATLFKKKGVSGGSADKKDYYYPDYLLNRKLISKEQYEKGLEKAREIEKGILKK